MGMLERKDLIMGFGHAVYTESDPRNVIIKGCSKQLSDSVGDKYMYKVSERVEGSCGERRNFLRMLISIMHQVMSLWEFLSSYSPQSLCVQESLDGLHIFLNKDLTIGLSVQHLNIPDRI